MMQIVIIHLLQVAKSDMRGQDQVDDCSAEVHITFFCKEYGNCNK